MKRAIRVRCYDSRFRRQGRETSGRLLTECHAVTADIRTVPLHGFSGMDCDTRLHEAHQRDRLGATRRSDKFPSARNDRVVVRLAVYAARMLRGIFPKLSGQSAVAVGKEVTLLCGRLTLIELLIVRKRLQGIHHV